MTLIGNITEQICDNIVSELSKDVNKEKLQKNILDPMLKYFINELYPYIITLIILIILIFLLGVSTVSMLIFKKTHVSVNTNTGTG